MIGWIVSGNDAVIAWNSFSGVFNVSFLPLLNATGYINRKIFCSKRFSKNGVCIVLR